METADARYSSRLRVRYPQNFFGSAHRQAMPELSE
jgi:hypothetical protein